LATDHADATTDQRVKPPQSSDKPPISIIENKAILEQTYAVVAPRVSAATSAALKYTMVKKLSFSSTKEATDLFCARRKCGARLMFPAMWNLDVRTKDRRIAPV